MLASTLLNRQRLSAPAAALALLFTVNTAFALQSEPSNTETQPAISPLKYEDTFNLEFVASPQFISSDTVIYSRQSMDIMTDSRQSRLWQVNIKSGEHRPFIGDDVNLSQATLSPNGKYIAYTKAVKGRAQLHLYYVDSKQSVRLTNLSETPRQITWSNDSKTLAFTLLSLIHI